MHQFTVSAWKLAQLDRIEDLDQEFNCAGCAVNDQIR
jgi:hypothetical protein